MRELRHCIDVENNVDDLAVSGCTMYSHPWLGMASGQPAMCQRHTSTASNSSAFAKLGRQVNQATTFTLSQKQRLGNG